MKPKISVILPVYNTARYFRQAIESVINQTLSPYEIIVIDDGSTDNILWELENYKDKIIFINKEHGGISSAYNLGIRIAKGDWIAFCDGDDYWDINKLNEQSKLIDCNNDFIFCDKFNLYENDSRFEPFHYPKGIGHNPLLSLLKSFFASPSTVIIRKTVFNQAGYFDERLSSSEDYDLWIRIAHKIEGKFLHCESPLIFKRIRQTSIQGVQGEKKLIKILMSVLVKNKNLFTDKLNISNCNFHYYIGLNYGFLLKKHFLSNFSLFIFYLNRSLKHHPISLLASLYRLLFWKKTKIPWYK